MTLLTPADAVEGMLAKVDGYLESIGGDHPIPFVQARMAVAQVQATCALVHAVRDLTDAVRASAPPCPDVDDGGPW